jgi:hypothetical protein
LSLSYFTSPLNKKPVISEEEESVAKIGLSLDGLAEVASCSVEAGKASATKRKKKKRIKLIPSYLFREHYIETFIKIYS